MRKKKSNLKKMSLKTIVLIIIFIFFFTISVGYSYLKQSLSMLGKSTIVQQSGSNEFEDGNSTYTWEITSSWGQGGTSMIFYNIKLVVVNMDKDIESWEIGFDIPESYNDAQSNIWSASARTYENGRLTLFAHDYESFLAKGDILTIEFQLAFDEEVDLYLNNLTLNGYLATNE